MVTEKNVKQYKRKQKNLFVAKAIEAKVWLLLQVKIETKARFLAMRLVYVFRPPKVRPKI